MNEQELRELAGIVKEIGERRREDAAYGGEMHDGGGGALVNEANAFLAGLNKMPPGHWGEYVTSLRQRQEANKRREKEEYEIYLRVKRRIEGGESD